MIRSLLLAALALGGGLFATGAAADWLVAKDGSRIETQGPWEVKGRLVVFTTAQGELASMRADDLDLGESRALTEAGPAPATAPPAPPARAERSAALVITGVTSGAITRSEKIGPGLAVSVSRS